MREQGDVSYPSCICPHGALCLPTYCVLHLPFTQMTMTAPVRPSGDASASGESNRRVTIGILALQVRKNGA